MSGKMLIVIIILGLIGWYFYDSASFNRTKDATFNGVQSFFKPSSEKAQETTTDNPEEPIATNVPGVLGKPYEKIVSNCKSDESCKLSFPNYPNAFCNNVTGNCENP